MSAAIIVVVVALTGLAIFDRLVVGQKLIALAREQADTQQAVVGQVLEHMVHRDEEARLERERMLRVIVAKNSGELANLERIETAQRKVEADASRRMTEAEFEAWIADDLRRMGEDPSRVFTGGGVPATPEGL